MKPKFRTCDFILREESRTLYLCFQLNLGTFDIRKGVRK